MRCSGSRKGWSKHWPWCSGHVRPRCAPSVHRTFVPGIPGTPDPPSHAGVRTAPGLKWAVQDSNLRPPACKAGALPAELTARAKGSHNPPRPRTRPASRSSPRSPSSGSVRLSTKSRSRPQEVQLSNSADELRRLLDASRPAVHVVSGGSKLIAEDLLEDRYHSTTGRTSTAPPMRAAGIREASSIAASRSSASNTR